jgi:hypothetical protein
MLKFSAEDFQNLKSVKRALNSKTLLNLDFFLPQKRAEIPIPLNKQNPKFLSSNPPEKFICI